MNKHQRVSHHEVLGADHGDGEGDLEDPSDEEQTRHFFQVKRIAETNLVNGRPMVMNKMPKALAAAVINTHNQTARRACLGSLARYWPARVPAAVPMANPGKKRQLPIARPQYERPANLLPNRRCPMVAMNCKMKMFTDHIEIPSANEGRPILTKRRSMP